jgi:hypothetical protein
MDTVEYTPWLDKVRSATSYMPGMLVAADLIWWASSPDQFTMFKLAERNRKEITEIIRAIRSRFKVCRVIEKLNGEETSVLQTRSGRKSIRQRVFQILRNR